MCGITGYFRHQDENSDVSTAVKVMNDALMHRGPDSAGVWRAPEGQENLALGHRRLAIVDLSPLGAQPMMSASGRYIIVFNGEIYNFRDLSAELSTLGCVFKGGSDTEVLLAAIEQWGIKKTLTRLVGMFAFALYDQKTKELTLARDAMGKKPLYFGWDKTRRHFAFASELKAIVANAAFQNLDINADAVDLYLRWRYIPDPYSIYKNIWKLPPSSFVTFSMPQILNDFDVERDVQKYWNLTEVVDQEKNNKDEASSIRGLRDVLHKAIEQRMIADVPLGAFLSGGIDSSLVVAMMQEQSDTPINSFSIAFDDTQYNEAEKARDVAHHLGTNHTEMLLSAKEALGTVDMLGSIFDEPFGDPSAIPTYHVCRLAKDKMTVALSGDGGDESFCGYSFYVRIEKIISFMKVPWALRVAAAKILSAIPLNIKNLSKAQRQKIALMLQAKCPDDLYPLIHSYWYAVTGDDFNDMVSTPYHNLRQTLKNKNIIERMMAYDARMFLAGDVLTKVDRCSMANSLEVRSPLLDTRVVDYAWGMDFHLKKNGTVQKYALKQLLTQYVPDHIINQKKQGFSIPHGKWLKDELKDWAEDLLNPQALEQYGLIAPEKVTPFWKAHKQGQQDYGHYLWTIVCLQNWARTWR